MTNALSVFAVLIGYFKVCRFSINSCITMSSRMSQNCMEIGRYCAGKLTMKLNICLQINTIKFVS